MSRSPGGNRRALNRGFNLIVEGRGIHRIANLERLLDLALLREQGIHLLFILYDLGILPGFENFLVAFLQGPGSRRRPARRSREHFLSKSSSGSCET